MNELIYVTEDNEDIRELIAIALKGSLYEVETFENAEDSIAAIENKIPDLAVFDIMLPKMTGIDALIYLRNKDKYKSLPIIILTAKDSELDKIKGLDSGADDYITKPFSVMEFMARIRAVLRRSKSKEENNKLFIGKLSLDNDTREVCADDIYVNLTFKEYELLNYLIKNKNRVVSRNEILNAVWGYDYEGETRTVDIHIATLRQKLNSCGGYIKTIRGMGYRFDANKS